MNHDEIVTFYKYLNSEVMFVDNKGVKTDSLRTLMPKLIAYKIKQADLQAKSEKISRKAIVERRGDGAFNLYVRALNTKSTKHIKYVFERDWYSRIVGRKAYFGNRAVCWEGAWIVQRTGDTFSDGEKVLGRRTESTIFDPVFLLKLSIKEGSQVMQEVDVSAGGSLGLEQQIASRLIVDDKDMNIGKQFEDGDARFVEGTHIFYESISIIRFEREWFDDLHSFSSKSSFRRGLYVGVVEPSSDEIYIPFVIVRAWVLSGDSISITNSIVPILDPDYNHLPDGGKFSIDLKSATVSLSSIISPAAKTDGLSAFFSDKGPGGIVDLTSMKSSIQDTVIIEHGNAVVPLDSQGNLNTILFSDSGVAFHYLMDFRSLIQDAGEDVSVKRLLYNNDLQFFHVHLHNHKAHVMRATFSALVRE